MSKKIHFFTFTGFNVILSRRRAMLSVYNKFIIILQPISLNMSFEMLRFRTKTYNTVTIKEQINIKLNVYLD